MQRYAITLLLWISLAIGGSAWGADHPLLARDSASAWGDVYELDDISVDDDGALTVGSSLELSSHTVQALTEVSHSPAIEANASTNTILTEPAIHRLVRGYPFSVNAALFTSGTAPLEFSQSAAIETNASANTVLSEPAIYNLIRSFAWAVIEATDIANWDTAFGWGDHSGEGYLTSESDPVFGASEAASITGTDTSNWDTAFGWGDHSAANYLDLDTYPDADTDSTDDFSGSYDDLADLPANIDEDSTDDLLSADLDTEAELETQLGDVTDVFTDGDTIPEGNIHADLLRDSEVTYATVSGNDAATDVTGAELETLSDDSMADTLHRHSELSASDGTPNPAVSVDASGNVGIGTASPGADLHVAGTNLADTPVAEIILSRDWTSSAVNRASALWHYRHSSSSMDYLMIGVTDKSEGAPNSTANAKVIIGGNGRVGIGTIAPGATLDVRGSAIFNQAGADADFRVEGQSLTHGLFVDASAGKVYLGGASGVTDSDIDLTGNEVLEYHLDDDDDNTATANIDDSVGSNDGEYRDASGIIQTQLDTSTEHIGTGAMGFDGGDEYIDTNTDAAVAGWFSDDFSISLWFYAADGQPAAKQYLFGVDDPDVDMGELECSINTDGRIQVVYTPQGDATVSALTGQKVLPDEDTGWRHIVVVYDSSVEDEYGLSIYLDGIHRVLMGPTDKGDTSGVSDPNPWAADIAMFIGANNDAGSASGFFQGGIDEFRIYNDVLTQNEIQALFNNGAGTDGDGFEYAVEVEGDMHVAGALHSSENVIVSDLREKEVEKVDPETPEMDALTSITLVGRLKRNPSSSTEPPLTTMLNASRLAALQRTGAVPPGVVRRRQDGLDGINVSAALAWQVGENRQQAKRIKVLEARANTQADRIAALEAENETQRQALLNLAKRVKALEDAQTGVSR